ncbi:MAG: hypothetical protein ABEJ74_07570 [Haloferacaceae archaeon]
MDGSVESLSVHLDALKRAGANLLVIHPQAPRPGCRGLMGVDDQPRRRLFVTTGGYADALSGFDDDPDPDRLRHVAVAPELVRSAAAGPAPDASTDPVWRTTVDSLEALPQTALAVEEQLSAFEAGDTVSGELRVCFDSLDPLLETHDLQRFFRFLHVLTTRVRAATGLGHFHVAAGTDQSTLDTLEPLFDAVVRYRSGPEGFAQRWRFRDADIETDWLPVS